MPWQQGKKRNFEVLDAIEFLHRICLHIPDPYESLIRYNGFYANAARGKRKKLGLEEDVDINITDDTKNKKSFKKSWSRFIYKIYETNPLICPSCGSTMKIISFIHDRNEITKILKHLNLWHIQYPNPPPNTDELTQINCK